MERITIYPRNNWKQSVENLGFGFHSTDTPYWDESAYYKFSMNEILQIERATQILWKICLEAVEHVINKKLYSKFCIPDFLHQHIENSFNEDLPSIYGRFDLAYRDGQIKLLEFNADTPTSLFEASVVQWHWLQDLDAGKDQFNSIHEKLIDYWIYLKNYLNPGKLYFSCIKNSLEDLTTTEYLRDCALQAGIKTDFIFIDDIGFANDKYAFVDLRDEEIKNIFKLYPWEWLANEEFGKYISLNNQSPIWIEPSWKMILSNKAVLPILWELYPDCPYLLPAYFEKNGLSEYAKKPILSREGSNITLVKDGLVVEKTDGEYGEDGFVYQQLFDLPNFSGNNAIIGSWVIGQQAAGIGIRESNGLITTNTSRFIPHLIEN